MCSQDISQFVLKLTDARRRHAEFVRQVYLSARADALAEPCKYSPDLAIRALALEDLGVVYVAPRVLRWTVGPGIGQDIR